MRILVTGAGGVFIPWLIKHLQSQNHVVLAADMNKNATGLFLADKGFVIPRGDSNDFLPAIIKICQDECVSVFIPLVDEELIASTELEGLGIVVLTPRKKFIEVALDKYRLNQELKSSMVVPETHLANVRTEEYPVVIKPRFGRGSRDVFFADTKAELDDIVLRSKYPLDQILIQKYISGDEYTVSCVVWRDGIVRAVVPKKVIIKEGITKLAVTQKDKSITEICHKIQSSLRADGPFNVQLRIDKETGVPQVFEINPRYSTTVSLTTACGIDEVGGIIKLATGQEANFGEWKEDIVLMRHNQDIFMYGSWWRWRQPEDYSR